jgi:hypothetical protein
MNFERGINPYETLKVGRKANAAKVEYFEIKGEIVAHLISERVTNKMKKEWSVRENNTLTFFENFSISGNELITALIILKRDGICRDFNDYIHELISMRFLIKMKSYKNNYDNNSFPIDYKKELEIKTRWVLVIVQNSEEFEFTSGKKFQLTFGRTGLDLFYQNELYRIAPPKDGGIKFESKKI